MATMDDIMRSLGIPTSNESVEAAQPAPVAPVMPAPAFQMPAQVQEVETTTTSRPVTPGMVDAMGQVNAANQAQVQALDTFASRLAQVQPEEAAARAAYGSDIGSLEQGRMDTQSKIQAESEKIKAEIAQQTLELASTKPETFWAKADTGDKVMMALAVALGGIGQGLSGSRENAALTAMNSAITQDLQLQRDQIQQKADALKAKKGDLIGQLEIQDRANREFALRKNESLNKLNLVLDGLKSQTTNAQTLANIEQKQGEIRAAQAQAQLGLETQAAGQVQSSVKRQEIVGGKGEIPISALPKDTQEATKIIASKNANIAAIRNEIGSALRDLQNPKTAEEDKIRIGQGLIKTLNSTQGADAVGVDEAKRLASELQGNVADVAKMTAQGAAAGSVIGSAVPLVGTVLGGVAGGIAGAAQGLFAAHNDPGGIRFKADVEGFTKRVELTAKKLDDTMEVNRLTTENMRKGMPIDQAAKVAEETVTARYKKAK